MRQAAGPGTLGEALRHHLGAGGKRLRARLALRAAADAGLDRDAAVVWAAACELLHNATLVHDDLCDRDPQRRGRLAVWARFGETAAVCLGDLLLTEAVAVLDRLPAGAGRDAARGLLTGTARALAEGQVREVDAAAAGVPDAAACTAVAEGKTVPLVTLPVDGVLALAGADAPARQAARAAFAHLGHAYQILDDVQDLVPEGARPAGQDLRRRVPNAALAAFRERAGSLDCARLDRDWRDGRMAERADAWAARIAASPAPADALARAGERIAAARAAAAEAPPAARPGFAELAGTLSGWLARLEAATGPAAPGRRAAGA